MRRCRVRTVLGNEFLLPLCRQIDLVQADTDRIVLACDTGICAIAPVSPEASERVEWYPGLEETNLVEWLAR
jgi:hypothetical protein